MALIKQTIYKGISANYWKIIKNDYAKFSNTTQGVVALYVNKQLGKSDEINNVLKTINYSFTGELRRPEVYVELVKPIIKRTLVSQAKEQIVDEQTGEILQAYQPTAYEEVDINELSGAENDL